MSDDDKPTVDDMVEVLDLRHNYILVRHLDQDPQLAKSGRLWIPMSTDRDPRNGQREIERVGIVVSVSPGPLTDVWDQETETFRRRPMTCKAGDKVVTMGTWHKVVANGEVLEWGQDHNIIGVFRSVPRSSLGASAAPAASDEKTLIVVN